MKGMAAQLVARLRARDLLPASNLTLDAALREETVSGSQLTFLTTKLCRHVLEITDKSGWASAASILVETEHRLRNSHEASRDETRKHVLRQRKLVTGLHAALVTRSGDDNWLCALSALPAITEDCRVAAYDHLQRTLLDSGRWCAALHVSLANDVPNSSTCNKRLAIAVPASMLPKLTERFARKDALISVSDTFATAAAMRQGEPWAIRFFIRGFRVDASACGATLWRRAERFTWKDKADLAMRLVREGHNPTSHVIGGGCCALSRDLVHDSINSGLISPFVVRQLPREMLIAGGRVERLIAAGIVDTAIVDAIGHELLVSPDKLKETEHELEVDDVALRRLTSSAFWLALLQHGCVEHLDRGSATGRQHIVKMCLKNAQLRSKTLNCDQFPRVPILIADETFVVMAKPPQMPTVGHPYQNGPSPLSRRFVERFHTAEVSRGGQVHRLDTDTSGVIAFARTEDAARVLKAGHRRAAISEAAPMAALPIRRAVSDAPKRYLVICRDFREVKGAARGTVTASLDGATAKSKYVILETFGHLHLVMVDIFTGRHHQVRRHMAGIGLPLINDEQYGGDMVGSTLLSRIAIHAAETTVLHPSSGQPILLSQAPPEDFSTAISRLRAAVRGRSTR